MPRAAAGYRRGMSTHVSEAPTPSRRRLDRSRLTGLLAVAGGGLVFAVLLLLVRAQWAPLESVDHGLAARLNTLVADRPTVVKVLRAVTTLGSYGVLMWLVAIAAIVLLVRRLYRLAAYLVVTSVGALILDPALKLAVGRLRPVVADPIAHGQGNSFPSGHALGSIICYGALLLVFLPAMAHGLRRVAIGVATVLVLVVGVSRIMLGVHYLSDVVGAWGLGVTWLGLTAFAFELWRHEAGRRVTHPLTEGLEPEQRADLAATDHGPRPTGPAVGWPVAATIVGLVLIFGLVTGLGELIVHYAGKNFLGDWSVPHWFAKHRTPTGNSVSWALSKAGDTHMILAVGLVTGSVAIAAIRRWRPVVFLLALMFGELALFLASAATIGRPRPEVSHLDSHLPTSSYPSGHVAATICLYTAIALLVLPRTRQWWRWVFVALAVIMPILVAASRMYRGMHHPTDVLGSLVLAAAWIPAAYLTIRPNQDLTESATRSQPAVAEPRSPALAEGRAG